MKAIDYRVSLDMFDVSSQTTIKAKKGDSACKIHITLTENGKIYKISEGNYATFSAKKSDGTFVYDKCTIENNTIVYDFMESVTEDGTCQISACEGVVSCEVALLNNKAEQLTSPRFTLIIDDTVYNGEDITSSPEANALKGLIKEADEAVNSANKMVADIEQKLEDGEFVGEKGDKGDKGDTGGVGQETAYGGDIFNDLENNLAIGEYSHAEGKETQAGSMAFSITSLHDNEKAYTLDSVEGLAVGDVYSVAIYYSANDSFHRIENAGKITNIVGNKVYVDTYYGNASLITDEDYRQTAFRILAKPLVGTWAMGVGAHAQGYKTKAIGAGAHAQGYNTLAFSNYAHAEGMNTQASYNAHAEGYNTKALGLHSHTEGQNNIASGISSHAEGDTTNAIGNGSHTEGAATNATASYAHAEGSGTNASGTASHTEGQGTKASGVASHAEGINTEATIGYSHAEGNGTKATNWQAHSEGSNTIASGMAAHAEGNKTTASGTGSHAEGKETTAQNEGAHAEGHANEANGMFSHAEGQGTTASGICSHSEGQYTEASGNFSHASGLGTKATEIGQNVTGRYNSDDPEAVFIVGTGTSDSNRNNGFCVMADGSVMLCGVNFTQAQLYKILTLIGEV